MSERASIPERLSTLEATIESMNADRQEDRVLNKEIQTKLDAVLLEHSRYKGFLGGIMFIGACLGAFLKGIPFIATLLGKQ